MKKLLSILAITLSFVAVSFGQATDLKVVSLTAPTDGCDLKINEDVRVRVQNVGATQIFGNVTFTYILDGGTPVTELVTGATILPQAFYTHTFVTKADLSAVTSFSFTLAASVANDVNLNNDTLKNQVVSNLVLQFPYFNDFTSFNNNALGNLPEGFISAPDALTSYSWRARGTSTSIASGPQTDNTPTGLSRFLMVDGAQGSGGNETTFESPCVSLLGVSTPVLEFYYHMYGIDIGSLYVEAKSDQFPNWTRLDSIVGRQQTSRTQPWRKKSIGLTQYAGQFMSFRFIAKRSSGGNNGNIAIDDIGIVLPDTGQVQLVSIFNPSSGLCNYSSCEPVRFRVKNVGNDTLKSLQAEYTIDGGTPVTQTFNISIAPFKSTNITFSQCADLSIPKTYTIAGKLTLSTDTDTTDNELSVGVDHLSPITVPYFEDFESFNQSNAGSAPNNTGNHPNGWSTNPTFSASTSAFKWIVGRGVATPGGATGPNKDHTRGNSIGKYFYADGDEGSPFQTSYLESTCIDFTNVLAPRLKYWYHMFGFDMGDIFVEVNSDQGWVRVDSLKGQDRDQTTSASPWKLRTVNIEPQVKGKQARIRFIAIKGGTGFASTMAIDDIFIYDLTDVDVGPVRMVQPDTTKYTCYNSNQEFGVLLQNFGSRDIDFTVDTTRVKVFVTKNGLPWDTAVYDVSNNNFHGGPLKTDEIDTVFFTGVDMSEIGADYGFTIVTDMLTGLDTVPGTDTLRPDNIITRRSAGVAFASATTVCEGTGVTLSDTSFFGAIQWQRQVGTQWFNEFGPNRDSANYVVLPPNAVNTYRAKICDSTYSNILTVNVTKVPSPTAINDTICGSGQINLAAIQPPGTNRVFWYSDPIAPGVLTFGTSYSRNLDTTSVFYIGAQKDSCFSGRVPVQGVVLDFPTIEFEQLDTTICSDTTYYINAGANLGLNATYVWSSNDQNVNGKTIQTIGVDPTRLNLRTEYWYTVKVLANGKCETLSDSVKITIIDSCKVGLNDLSILGELSVFPNPTDGMVTLQIETEQSTQANIQIISMRGEVIYERQNINTLGFNEQFDLSSYSKGIYYLRLISNEESVVKKIILR